MERIQSAIAKARAERRSALGDPATGPVATPVAAPVAGPPLVPADMPLVPPAGAAGDDPAVAARWAALAPNLPDPGHLDRHRIVTAAAGRAAVPFDVLRTRTLQQMRVNNWHRVAITSPTEGCGKSTIALNLAFGLSRQPDLRTILCEADLRRPSLAGLLGITEPLQFARVLEGRAPFADHARRIGLNLAVAVNRGPARHSAEILHGPAVGPSLDAIEADYAPQVMIFDMPPLLVADDAMAFLGQVDAVLLVAAAEITTVKQIDACEREIAQVANVMGVVLNKCRYTGPDYGYDYY